MFSTLPIILDKLLVFVPVSWDPMCTDSTELEEPDPTKCLSVARQSYYDHYNDAWYVCWYFKICVKPLQLSLRNARQNAHNSARPKICLINKLSARRKKFTSKTISNEQKSATRMNTWQNHTNTQYNNKVHGKPCPWQKSICCMPMCCVVFRSIYRCHFVNCSAWCYIVGVVFAPFVNFIEKLHKFAFE